MGALAPAAHGGHTKSTTPFDGGKEKGQFPSDFSASSFTAGLKEGREDSKLFIRERRKMLQDYLASRPEGKLESADCKRQGCLKPKVKRLGAGRLPHSKIIKGTYFLSKIMLVLPLVTEKSTQLHGKIAKLLQKL